MVKSEITHKIYEPGNSVFISNTLQAQRYLEYLGPEFLLDIIWSCDVWDMCIELVYKRNQETAQAKSLWDQHLLWW